MAHPRRRRLPQELRDLQEIQRTRNVRDSEIMDFVEAHFHRPADSGDTAIIRSFLRHGRLAAIVTANRLSVRLFRDAVKEGDGVTRIPRWGGWREFTTIPEVHGEPPDELTKVELTRGGRDLLEAVPGRARRRSGSADDVAVYLHLGSPPDPAQPHILRVIMGDDAIGTVDVSAEPGLSMLAAETVRRNRMLALEGIVRLSAPPHASIELYYR